MMHLESPKFMMRSILLVLTLISVVSLSAQTFHPFQLISPALYHDLDINPIDLDQDDDNDILIVSERQNSIFWLENEGGEFKPLAHIDSPSLRIRQAKVADIDGDGWLDILVVPSLNTHLGWYKSLDGQGAFSVLIPLDTLAPDRLSNIILSDFSGDQLPDLLRWSNDGVAVHLNLGDGEFERSVSLLATHDGLSDVKLADEEGDGDLDLFVADDKGRVFLHENVNGTFQSANLLLDNLPDLQELLISDFDNDGDADFIHRSWFSETMFFVRNTDNGFSASVMESNMDQSRQPILEDFDFDGDDDLLIYSEGKFGVRYNLGDGPIGAEQDFWTDAALQERPIFMNVNNAGWTDIIIPDDRDDRLRMLLSDIDGQFQTVEVLTDFFNPVNNSVIDLNADGFLDVISANSEENSIYWALSNGDGTFSDQVQFTYPVDDFRQFVVADYSGDNAPDLLWVTDGVPGETTLLGWARGTNGNSYSSQKGSLELPSASYRIVAVQDMTQDGRNDVIVGRTPQGSLTIYRSETNGSLTLAGALASSGQEMYPETVVLEDMDGDGDRDVVCHQYPGNLVWIKSLGSGNYSGPILIDEMEWWDKKPAIEDVDSDGDLDIVIVNTGPERALEETVSLDRLLVYLNDGEGNFTRLKQPYLRPYEMIFNHEIAFADMDKDGHQDVVMANEDTDTKVVWFRNTGTGIFNAHEVLFETMSRLYQLVPTDVNNDGNTDFIINHSPGMSWVENPGTIYPLGDRAIMLNDLSAKAFPNPFHDQFIIQLESASSFSYALVDLQGTTVRSGLMQSSMMAVETDNLAAGLYLLRIESEGVVETKKVVKH